MKNELISEIDIFLGMNNTMKYPISDVDINDDDNGQGENHKSVCLVKTCVPKGVIISLEIDNGDIIPLDELSEKELECICEELEIAL